MTRLNNPNFPEQLLIKHAAIEIEAYFLMKGEKKKAKLSGSKGGKEHRGPGQIDEYNFFLAQDEEAIEEAVPEEKAKKRK